MAFATQIGDRILAFSVDRGYRYLFLSLILILLAFPLVKEYAPGRFLLDIFVSFVMIASMMAAVRTRTSLHIGLVLLSILLVARWAESVTNAPLLVFLSLILTTIYWSYVIVEILIDIFLYRSKVTGGMIYGALSVYLLIGLAFAFAYTIVDIVVPGSFDGISYVMAEEGHREFHGFLYFSFVTLTTLGYGDILPIMPAARAMAYMEAILGQIYLTVLVARLVSMYVAPSKD